MQETFLDAIGRDPTLFLIVIITLIISIYAVFFYIFVDIRRGRLEKRRVRNEFKISVGPGKPLSLEDLKKAIELIADNERTYEVHVEILDVSKASGE